MPRTAILQAAWSTRMDNWLCLPLEGTLYSYRPTITALEGSMFMSTANPWPCFDPLGREKATTVPRTQPVFSSWNLVTSSRLLRNTTTVKFTCLPSTPTLARIWFKNQMNVASQLHHNLRIKGIKTDLFSKNAKLICSRTTLSSKSSLAHWWFKNVTK